MLSRHPMMRRLEMLTSNRVIGVAQSQLGIKESPAGSNMTKYGKWYGMDGNPWCAMFVSWVLHKAGWSDGTSRGGKFAYCPYWVTWFKSKGLWKGRKSPAMGDIVFFAGKDGVACHVGIVEKVIDSNTVQTIEGNTSAGSNANGGQVQRRIRDFETVGSDWYILGFARPKYDAVKIVTATKELPLRADPWATAKRKLTYTKGTRLRITGTSSNGNWLRVQGKGWVYRPKTDY